MTNNVRSQGASFDRRCFLGSAIAAALAVNPALSFCANKAEAVIPDPDDAGYIGVDGGRIWYRIDGRRHFSRGRIPLVIVHGGPGASHHYLLPLVKLADERPVIFYDQLDCGRGLRTHDKRNWTVKRYVSEIDALRSALGLDRLFLLGSSCGATWVAEYAVRWPEGLVGAILASPFLSARRWMADTRRMRAALPPDIRATLEHHESAGTTESEEYHAADMEWLRRHVCRLDPWPHFVLRTFELFNARLYGHMWGPSESQLTGTLKDYDIEPRLPEIRTPTLYTCGEYDEATPASTHAFRNRTPGAEVEVFAGASHMPHAETQAAYISTLRAFMLRAELA
ncbi:MAG: proline iminopeptidase-family hydrolase [Pseudomonadota bacterium]|nr:proline iminopeptidase-family hydrolase [Pseudomonadota bacterium]